MLHLKKEFQDEILLSLIEFTQFRELVNHNLQKQRVDQNGDMPLQRALSVYGYETIQLAPGCPYSSILKNQVPFDIMEKYQGSGVSAKILELQYKTHMLFMKYVSPGFAHYEINISYQLRKRLNQDFGDMDRLVQNEKYRTLQAFDGVWSQCLEEQWKYCTNSISRFKQTQHWRRIKEHFQ